MSDLFPFPCPRSYPIFLPIVALYAITASYFAGVMVRLMLTLAPVVCVLSAIAFSECYYFTYQSDEKPTHRHRHLLSGDGGEELNDTSDSDEASEKKNHKHLYDKVKKLNSTLSLLLNTHLL